MTLVVTPGASDATSYADVTAALARAALDLRSTAFVALTTPQQEAALATATAGIDAGLLATGRQRGSKSQSDQALQQPRDDGVLAPPLVLATILYAFVLADKLSLGEIGTPIADTSNVKEDTVGELTTVFFAPSERAASAFEALPGEVRGLLGGLLMSTTAAWGSAVVSRGA